jgi:phosphoglycolate phosphatase-like HAD superfamily hydrolase
MPFPALYLDFRKQLNSRRIDHRMRIKLIVFDWDDVFTIGSKRGYYACYHKAVVGVGIHLSPEEEEKRILAKWGTTHIEEIKELLKEHPRLVDKACKIYEEALFDGTFVNELHVLPGTTATVAELGKSCILCVATGGHPELIKTISMPKFGIPPVLDILSSYELPAPQQKPSGFMVQHFMKKYNIKPEETLVVGDGKSDMLMAKNAGVQGVAVLTGHLTRKQAEELGVPAIKDITELPAFLVSIGKQ